MGITSRPELQAPLFGLFLIIYLVSVLGNLGMTILTKVDQNLQTPMYFFLRHLAITDLGYSTAVGPKMLENFVVDQNTISYYFCATQLAFFLVFIACELFILSVMSYDRYVAIYNPLLYTVIMSQRFLFGILTEEKPLPFAVAVHTQGIKEWELHAATLALEESAYLSDYIAVTDLL
ncbi:Hypothetical predicted protein [Marmota monax]|uniref:G-protein coupled receptors family 1 profile domain-containing protein n=1 Tax=Marmota monax TaxID=9995 RepID=A0A5E4CFW0_MARMO|nr:Hypothetical predicted protein [Marmota monax]